MARPTKLTPDTQKAIVKAVMSGATIEKVCEYVGIHKSTYYDWLGRGEKGKRKSKYTDFADAVTHAQAHAHVRATGALAKATLPTKQQSTTTETTTQTLLRTITHKNGTVEQVPYEAVTERRVTTVTDKPADWRAAVEFLKRRDSKNWSATQTVAIHDWRMQLLEDIQSGAVKLDAVLQAFGGKDDFESAINEPSLAARLFAAAGYQLQDAESSASDSRAG